MRKVIIVFGIIIVLLLISYVYVIILYWVFFDAHTPLRDNYYRIILLYDGKCSKI